MHVSKLIAKDLKVQFYFLNVEPFQNTAIEAYISLKAISRVK